MSIPNQFVLSDNASAILEFIRSTEDEYTSNEISDALTDKGTTISHRGAVGTINSLVKKGLAVREIRKDENGDEIKVVIPTDAGKSFNVKTINPKYTAYVEKKAQKEAKKASKADAEETDEDIQF